MRVDAIRLGYNTVYALDGGRVLVDTGPDYRGAREALMAALGGRLPELVVATHGHLDHAGLGRWWQEKGVPVAIGADDAALTQTPYLSSPAEPEAMVSFVQESGAPAAVALDAIAGLERRRDWALHAAKEGGYPAGAGPARWPTGLRYESYVPARLLVDGERLAGGLKVLMCPGHTPGNLVVVAEEERWLFAGDQLLPGLTPTPAIQAAPPGTTSDWRFRSLPAFEASLRRLSGLALGRCFPGHGEPFDGVTEEVEAVLRTLEQRTERVAAELTAAGPTTLYALAERLYPRAVRRRFWQIVATVLGHLDLLEQAGQARHEAGKWRATGG